MIERRDFLRGLTAVALGGGALARPTAAGPASIGLPPVHETFLVVNIRTRRIPAVHFPGKALPPINLLGCVNRARFGGFPPGTVRFGEMSRAYEWGPDATEKVTHQFRFDAAEGGWNRGLLGPDGQVVYPPADFDLYFPLAAFVLRDPESYRLGWEVVVRPAGKGGRS